MAPQFFHTLVEQMPTAFSFHEVIVAPDGSPEDYVFLEVNHAFEEMTGLRREDILGRKVTEAIPQIRSDAFDWIAFYGAVALTGVPQEFTQYSQSLKRWYRVNAFAPQRGLFVTLFNDVTAERENIAKLERQAAEIKALHKDVDILFNNTHDAVYLVRYENGEFRYITTNKTHQRLTGLRLEDLQGKTPREVFDTATADWVVGHYRSCLAQGGTITYEQTLDFPAGRRIWQSNLTPVLEDGEVRYIAGSMRDITELKAMEKEKTEALRRFEVLFEGHRAVMLVVDPSDGKILDSNPAASAFYGYTRGELAAMNIRDLNSLPSEEVSHNITRAASGEKDLFLFRHRLKGGEIRMVAVYSCPVDIGGRQALYSIIIDVTDREKLQQELVREKELLNITLTSIGDGVVTTDSNGRITMLNKTAQTLTGWNSETGRGRHFSEVFRLFNEQTHAEVKNPVEKVLQSGLVVGLANHTVLQGRYGAVIPIADSAAPIKDADGNIYGVVMVFRDVTREKEQQEKVYYLSYHDQLTGLYNRSYMEDIMEKLKTTEHLPLAVLMGDVNGLKITNDVFGHQAGDQLLKKVASVLKERVGRLGYVARWGGDEFVIVIPHADEAFAEQTIAGIKEDCASECNELLHVSVSLGYAVLKNSGGDMQVLLRQAENIMYHQKLLESKSYRNTIINTLLSTLCEKNMETEEHAMRLQALCGKIAEKMGMPSSEINDLLLFALLHDIGKVGVPQNILLKPGPLTEQEWEQMRKHPEIGYRIAQNTPELSSVAEFILYHHERWDGKGYPNRLSGSDIPLECRILAVADSFDAMTNDRVYRKAMPESFAAEEILRNRGTQFDPGVVDVFIRILKERA